MTISQKFTNNKFIGNTYTQFTVMESEQIAPKQFRIKVSSDKRLEFLGDGLLFSVGLAEQDITLDDSNHIRSLLVRKSTSSIVGGTGKMQKYENGIYTLKTISDHVYEATLTPKKSNIIVILMVVAVVVTLGVIAMK